MCMMLIDIYCDFQTAPGLYNFPERVSRKSMYVLSPNEGKQSIPLLYINAAYALHCKMFWKFGVEKSGFTKVT